MTTKQTYRIYMILRYFCVSCVVLFGIISIIGSGGGGGDGGGGGGSAPEISNFSLSPTSTTEGSGGGTIPVSGTLDFVDSDGNVSTLTLSIFDSNDNLLESSTDPIKGISGLTSGTIQGVYYINTSVVGEYPLEIYITDTTNLSSNILSGTFTVIHDDTNDLDSTFGNDGIERYDSTPGDKHEEGRAIVIQTDGKILVAGYTNDGNNEKDVLILRYNSDGTLDNTFGTNGVVLYDGGRSDEAYAISLQPDGKIVLVGYSWEMDKNVLVLRYNSDGTLDPTFGTNGVVTTDVETDDDGYAVFLQPDGKIVVAGETGAYDTYALVLRYNSDGTLDTTFGTNGVVIYDGIGVDIAYGVSVQPDGKIVVTGSTSEAYPRIAFTDTLILRYNSDGTLDNTFGSNGIVTYDNVDYDQETGKAIKIQPDGKIVIAGRTLILRYTDDGTLDNTFGTNGVVIYNIGYGNSFTLQPDGKIVVVGSYGSNILVLRYNIDGTLDTSFSGDGVGMYSCGGVANGYGVALQTDGKIVVTGKIWFYDQVADDDVLTIRIIGQ